MTKNQEDTSGKGIQSEQSNLLQLFQPSILFCLHVATSSTFQPLHWSCSRCHASLSLCKFLEKARYSSAFPQPLRSPLCNYLQMCHKLKHQASLASLSRISFSNLARSAACRHWSKSANFPLPLNKYKITQICEIPEKYPHFEDEHSVSSSKTKTNTGIHVIITLWSNPS